MISLQNLDFSVAQEYSALVRAGQSGAIAMFVGRVRDFCNEGSHSDKAFLLQHYPGMTEKILEKIEAQANQRWSLLETRIIHRVGKLAIDDQIVFVGVSATHRRQAFDACEFMIDILKTEAPFWKKEGLTWLEPNWEDKGLAERWTHKK